MLKRYYYVNDIGYHKRLDVYYDDTNENGEISTSLWSMDTGDLCGSCYLTEEQLQEMLNHYKITKEETL